MPVSLDYIIKEGKARILLYKKNENHDLLSEIKGRFKNEYKKLITILKRFGQFGVLIDEEKFKQVSGNTYEFKVNQLRVFCVILEGAKPITIVIHHYYKKQKQKIPSNERDKALRLSAKITELYNNGELIL